MGKLRVTGSNLDLAVANTFSTFNVRHLPEPSQSFPLSSFTRRLHQHAAVPNTCVGALRDSSRLSRLALLSAFLGPPASCLRNHRTKLSQEITPAAAVRRTSRGMEISCTHIQPSMNVSQFFGPWSLPRWSRGRLNSLRPDRNITVTTV